MEAWKPGEAAKPRAGLEVDRMNPESINVLGGSQCSNVQGTHEKVTELLGGAQHRWQGVKTETKHESVQI